MFYLKFIYLPSLIIGIAIAYGISKHKTINQLAEQTGASKILYFLPLVPIVNTVMCLMYLWGYMQKKPKK